MIPFVDLKAQYRSLKPEVDRAIQQVLDESQYILGPAVSAFERDFAAFCQTTEAIGVNSGSTHKGWAARPKRCIWLSWRWACGHGTK